MVAMPERETLPHFVARLKITAKADMVDSGPVPGHDDWQADHYKVTLRYARRQLTTMFYQGYGHHGKYPKATDVLSALISDARSYYDAEGFDDWCAELGYDSDSRKAERIYKTCAREAKRLQRFLGVTTYDYALSEVEPY